MVKKVKKLKEQPNFPVNVAYESFEASMKQAMYGHYQSWILNEG